MSCLKPRLPLHWTNGTDSLRRQETSREQQEAEPKEGAGKRMDDGEDEGR